MQRFRDCRILVLDEPGGTVIPYRIPVDLDRPGQCQHDFIASQFKGPVQRDRIRQSAVKVNSSVNDLLFTEDRQGTGGLDHGKVIRADIIQGKIFDFPASSVCCDNIHQAVILLGLDQIQRVFASDTG